jgi:hypothetical protein
MNTEQIAKAQKLLDGLKRSPQYTQYVREHKLKILDDRLAVYDTLLDQGLLNGE